MATLLPLSKASDSSRNEACAAFLQQEGWQNASCDFLAGDASFRTYYRLIDGTKRAVLMDSPPPEDWRQYVTVTQFLARYGYSVPEVYAKNDDHGFLLIEDFGDQTYTRLLDNGGDAQALYELAVDVLIDLHKNVGEKPEFIHEYDAEKLTNEASLFLEWYWPYKYGRDCDDLAKQEFGETCSKLFGQALESPKSIVLRDYHVDNLMLLESRGGLQKCGLLDYQDAIWGPVAFDLMSLLEDARRDVSKELSQKLWERYKRAFPDLNQDQLYQSGIILSASRHLKILGVFTRLAKRDNKTQYLSHHPRLLRLLNGCLQYPWMIDLKQWFDRYIAE